MNINAHDAIRLLREVAAGREDFVYRSTDGHDVNNVNYHCEYTYDGKPDCMIGVALHRAGVPVEELAALPSDAIGNSGVLAMLAGFGHTIDDQAVQVFRAAQRWQDQGHPWGQALKNAEGTYRTEVDQNV